MSKKDPREGIELPDPKTTARKVRVRRLKRQLKAAVSIAIAAAAGTYIACKGDQATKNVDPVPPNPTTDAVTNRPAPPDAASADASVDAAVDAATPDAGAPKDAALVPVDARKKDGGVDKTEHRKGMPVPDNLLE